MECLKKNPDAGMCFTDGYLVDHSTEPPLVKLIKNRHFRERVGYRDLLEQDWIGTTSQALIRREVFGKCGLFDVSMPARQDYEMWIRISKKYAMAGVRKGLYRYHKMDGIERISKNWANCIRGHSIIYRKYRKDIDADRSAGFNVRFYMAHYYMMWGRQERDVFRLVQALAWYLRALCMSPSDFIQKGRIRVEQIRTRRYQLRHNTDR